MVQEAGNFDYLVTKINTLKAKKDSYRVATLLRSEGMEIFKAKCLE